MDTKSKSFSYHIVLKTLATLLLTVLIFTVVAMTGYALYNDQYIGKDYFFQTEVFNYQLNRAFIAIGREKSEAISDVSSTIRYTTLDLEGKVIEHYSNAVLDPNTFGKDSYSLIYHVPTDEQSYDSYTEIPKGTAMSVYGRSPYIGDNYFVKYFDDIGDIDQILISFDYFKDSGKLGQEFLRYSEVKRNEHIVFNIGIGSLVVGVLLGIYLIGVTGQQTRNGPVTLHWFDKIWVEVVIMIASVMLLFGVQVLPVLPISYDLQTAVLWNTILSPIIYYPTLITTIVVASIFQFLLSLVRSFKAKQLLNRSIVWRLIYNFFSLFSIKHWNGLFQAKFVFYLLGYALINGILGVITLSGSGSMSMMGLVMMVVFNGLAIYRFNHHLKALKQLVDYADHSAKGQELNNISHSQLTPIFYDFADDLTAMNSGLNVAIDKAVNNERMRSELITNVTHDLKNPLTSIISYADLLQKEVIDNQTANDYIEVISEKSNRLKELIDHLVEASKVSSGVSEIKRESLDLIALGKQLEGEYQESLAEKQLQFVLKSNTDKAFIETDATYYTRILDNLFSNILKYAMPGTRVYCDIESEGDYHRLCLKNISNHPLEISADELTERFVRGDKARTSEGNGLGLGIAKSIAIALGAELEVFIDGDLFKACLKHPSALETSENKSE